VVCNLSAEIVVTAERIAQMVFHGAICESGATADEGGLADLRAAERRAGVRTEDRGGVRAARRI
jgi:hypothetical protein